jgi:hypothetical protein
MGLSHINLTLIFHRRCRPTNFVDAKILSSDLEGITMVSQDAKIETSLQHDLALFYDEVYSPQGSL